MTDANAELVRTVPKTTDYRRVAAHGHPRANRHGMVREHLLVAERALGKPLPPKAVVHHVDEDKSNNRNGNLVICQDHTYHLLLHTRARIVRAGGNPNTQTMCTMCRRPRDRSEFYPGQGHCRPCAKSYALRRKIPVPKRTRCKRGHEFTAENTYIKLDGRDCRECRRVRWSRLHGAANGRS